MENYNLSYRELIPEISTQEKWNEITLNTGGTQSTLQDIKVSEKAGGYCYKNATKATNRNRFIYWRTYHDVLELSEISLDVNLYENNVRYKFTDSPVLSVNVTEQESFVTILVTTVSSLHRIHFRHPDTVTRTDPTDTRSFSIFREANLSAARDPSTFHVIAQNTSSNNPIPHAAGSMLSPNGEEAHFGLAYQNNLVLYTMNCNTGHTVSTVLKEHNIMPRLFSNLKGAFIGKSSSADSDYVTSMVFNVVQGQTFLMALYRDDQIRMWSTVSMQCVSSISCVREGVEGRLQGPQSNALRKINETNLCAFLSHSMQSEFIRIRISVDSGSNFTLSREKIISAPQADLADFEVSDSRIWALWCNAEGEFSISNYSLVRGSGFNWISAAMEPPPDRYSVNIEGMDAREAYCSYVFHPGRFDRSVIAKALVMFRRSNVLFDPNLPMNALKDRVCQAVETEIQNEVKDFDITDEEYLEISTRLWERFYSCCEQYHMKASQPVGLVILDPIDAICVVKKNAFSLLRPCEILEHLLVVGEDIDAENVIAAHFSDNEKVGHDLIHLVEILSQLEKWLSDDVKVQFDKKLYHLEMPTELVSKLVEEIISADQGREILPMNFMVTIRQKLQAIGDLRSSMAMLLDCLRIDQGNPEGMQTQLDISNQRKFLFTVGNLFGSNIGISLVSESVRQLSLIKFAFCRNLLILQQILVDTFSLSCEVLETIRSQFMPDTVIFLQSYYAMVWISETPVNLASVSTLDSSIQRLNMLQLIDSNARPYQNTSHSQSSPLLRVFLQAKGLSTALALYASESDKIIENPQWQNTLLPLTTIVSQLIWPVSFNFVFGEWLFSTCQHIIIEDYVRLLNSWCEWNMCSRQFTLAISLLDCGESNKAYDLFLQSSKGVLSEQFMSDKILKAPLEEFTPNQALAQYYLKVIQLLEQHNALEHIISMSQVAIGILEKDDPQLPMFQSIVFNNHLILEHYQEAYHSLIYNAESSRRKDCLRQLVAALFSKQRFDLLMHFPYVGLQDEFESIVESRARSLAIEDNEIYNFLYAFHVEKGNMRKASAILYEQAMRFQLDSDSLESMQKRYNSLLICVNALHLIDERYRWIAKPVIADDYANATANESMETDQDLIKEQIVVLEIKDIRKELLQTEALLCLAKHRRDIGSYVNAGPLELTVILANAGLYTAALKLAKGFGISLVPVFQSLAAACVQTSDENPNEPWAWLQENDLADLPHKTNAADMAWALLRKLVEDNEDENSTVIRKSVVTKLLSLNAFVPQWLYASYKEHNSSEFLRLFVVHGRLLEAADFAKELIWALLGPGSEYFDFKKGISVVNPGMCIPLNSIDMLLHGLRLNSDDIEYKKALTELEELLHEYIRTAMRISDDKIQFAAEAERSRERQRL